MDNRPVAIGARLKSNELIFTIGFKPNFQDYSKDEQQLIMSAGKIYYPTAFYADLFNTMGKDTFPSFHTYKFAQDKIKQTAIFNMLNIPHPVTRTFYGKKQKSDILNSFKFPFIAKKAKGSSKGNHIYLIHNRTQLDVYLKENSPAYIQEYFPITKDIRIIIIGNKIRLAYFRLAAPGSFKTNISQGGSICFDKVPDKALDLALMTASKCGWDDVGLDIIEYEGSFYVLEANMKYGTRGFVKAGINYKKMLADLILQKKI